MIDNLMTIISNQNSIVLKDTHIIYGHLVKKMVIDIIIVSYLINKDLNCKILFIDCFGHNKECIIIKIKTLTI